MVGRVSRTLVLPIQAMVDFLIADRCLLCQRDRWEATGNSGLRTRFQDSLSAGNEIRLLRLVRLVNHPVCPTCSGEFEDTREPGRLASLAGDGALVLPDGSRFETRRPGGEADAVLAPPETPPLREIQVIAPFRINDPVLQLVHLLKFSGYRSLALLLARLVAAAARRFEPPGCAPPVLVPVPMSGRRRRQRGFNQAELIGRELARELGLSLDTRMLRRIRLGQQQSKTPRQDRAANVQGAFAADPALAAGRRIGLVDDLVTSGSTAAACAAALLEAGAVSIEVLCFARAL